MPQLNSLSYGDMIYKDGNTTNDVKEVWYKDIHGYAYLIWPDQYWADNIEIHDLNRDITIGYTIDNHGEPVYTIGNRTLPGLPPGSYIITGTIKRGDGSLDQDVEDFFHITTQGDASGCWSAGNFDNITIPNQFTGEYDPYGVYTAGTTVVDELDLDMSVFVAYHVPASGGSELKLLGFGHYSSNFQNATPIILRRISIEQELKFYNADTGGSEVSGTYTLDENTTGRLYPMFAKSSPDDPSWQSILIPTNDYTYEISDGCDATVVKGDKYIDINIGTTGGYIEFEYNNTENTHIASVTKTLYLAPRQDRQYTLWAGGNIINTSANNPMVLTQPFTFWIKDVKNETSYDGNNYSFTSSDTSVATVSGTTIHPVRTANSGDVALITGVVEDTTVTNGIYVSVGNISTYYKAGILDSQNNIIGSVNTWNAVNNATWSNPSNNNMFGIELYEDSSGNTSIPIYCDSINESPIYGSVTDNQMTLTYSGTGNGAVTIPIYTDSSKTTQLGLITVATS